MSLSASLSKIWKSRSSGVTQTPKQGNFPADNGPIGPQPALGPAPQSLPLAPSWNQPPQDWQWGAQLQMNQPGGISPPMYPNSVYSQQSMNNSDMPRDLSPLTHPNSVYNAHANPATTVPIFTAVDQGKMSVSIDFGTTFSGVAYGSSRIAGGKIQQILHWPGSSETFRKVPTCLLYDETGRVVAWGIDAKSANPLPGQTRCEWFKLFLEPRALRNNFDPRLPRLPPGKRPIDLIIDYLSCLWEYAKGQITRDLGFVADLDTADVWLPVPAAWDAKGCSIMREAAIKAGLVRWTRDTDLAWRERLRIITEPEAAAVHCAHLTSLHELNPGQYFMICDAGGGTVDLATYKIIGQLSHLAIAEVCTRSGANCGSLFLDFRFRKLVKTLLDDHPSHLDAISLTHFMRVFSETDKPAYKGESDDSTIFYFPCFNAQDPRDSTVGLISGQLEIFGNVLRREVFDPVINQVLELIQEQISKTTAPVDALLLVGGFSGCEYLVRKIDEHFGSTVKVIARPSDADTATLRGAAYYGLARRPLISNMVATRAYIMKVRLPVEPEDRLHRPAYIINNDTGAAVCQNRLQYLVAKGAVLRKGQRVTAQFCKFSQTPQDRLFVAALYTSDNDKVMRYSDEGEITELCKWTVDLGILPPFQQNWYHHAFYTTFELGLELDSAEIRGVLLYNNQEWGKVTFEFPA